MFLPDAVLLEEGQTAKEIFVLVEGKVAESFTVDEAKLCLLCPVGVGEIIGCSALIPPFVQRCTARSLGEIEVLAIHAVGLRELFERDCRLAASIQQHVIEVLLELIGKLRVAGVKTI